MSAIAVTHRDEPDDVLRALDVCRSIHGESAELISGVFAQLESALGGLRQWQEFRERELSELRHREKVWEQECALLEIELEATRNRAAATSHALTRQKRAAKEQQSRLTDELKQMRQALQKLAQGLATPTEEKRKRTAPDAGPGEPPSRAGGITAHANGSDYPAKESTGAGSKEAVRWRVG